MDKVEFRVEEHTHEFTHLYIAQIYINGHSLIDMLRDYEKQFALREHFEAAAGGYRALESIDLYKNLTVPDQFESDESGKIIILGCECGHRSHWPMRVRVQPDDNSIVWHQFEQPNRTESSLHHWDYTNFGSFCFSSDHYQQALQQLAATMKNSIHHHSGLATQYACARHID
jgi:hypothetical protein